MGNKAVAALQRDLEVAHKRWQDDVQSIANEARQLMLPYFTKRNLVYVAGNGSWYIGKRTKGDTFMDALNNAVDADDLPKWIQDILRIEVDHMNYLGFYIEDIGH